MPTLPQLIQEDIRQLDEALRELLARTDATTGLVIDKGGFLIASQGEAGQFDLTSLAALASGAFMANQTIASLVHETHFTSVYQQGENFSMLVTAVDAYCLLVVIFDARVNAGLVKYFAAPAAARVARQMLIARARNPARGLDLSELNLADTAELFRKKA
jgi:predicted regulator of Ras-like GTPase activity (Roadblock/LC7/MglB family)